ncbi:hypothetical protein K2Z84_28460 [Candidatus Binatia bacterium]|nr:hypothetical protein [Candidatus Binatia bacterium]
METTASGRTASDAGAGAPSETLAEALGRASARVDALRADLDVSERVRLRLAEELRRLGRRIEDVEAECRELSERVRHRDRLLAQIFGSRSWRVTQALRRALKRE